jgi:hypothetical protein
MKLNKETQVIITEHKNINNDIEHNFDIALKVSQLLTEVQSPKFNIDDASILSLEDPESLHHKQKVLAIGHPLNAIYKIIAKNNNDEVNTLRLVDLYPNSNVQVETVNMEKSVALFENHIKTFALLVKYNGLDSYYKYVKGFSNSLINGDIKSTIVDDLNYLRSTFNSAQDELKEHNIGGLVVKFNPSELKQEFFNSDSPVDASKYERKEFVYKFFVHKFLDVLLSQLPNFDSEEEIAQLIYDVKVKSVDTITQQLKEKLADLGVTDLIGEFEVSAFRSSRVIKLITDIFHYQNNTRCYDEKGIDVLIDVQRKGTYIDLEPIKFSVGKEYRNDKGDLMQVVKIKKA